jgi:AraC-like DNA-binding protein
VRQTVDRARGQEQHGSATEERGSIGFLAGDHFHYLCPLHHHHLARHRALRSPQDTMTHHKDLVLLTLVTSGVERVVQDGREAVLRKGDFAIHDSTRPYSLFFDTSFSEIVLQIPRALFKRRLEHCRGDLIDPMSSRRVSEIAYAWGFNSTAHFCRSFKSRYGMSSRDYRERHAAQDGKRDA